MANSSRDEGGRDADTGDSDGRGEGQQDVRRLLVVGNSRAGTAAREAIDAAAAALTPRAEVRVEVTGSLEELDAVLASRTPGERLVVVAWAPAATRSAVHWPASRPAAGGCAWSSTPERRTPRSWPPAASPSSWWAPGSAPASVAVRRSHPKRSAATV